MKIFLETERLTLRELTDADADRLFELDGDPEVMRFLNGGRPTPREEILGRVLPRMLRRHDLFGHPGYWAAEIRSTGEFIGWFEFRPLVEEDAPETVELGYRLRRTAWGKGYATEGARALVREGFTGLGVERVVARTMAVNTGSRNVMEKAGLRHVRTFFADWPETIPGSEHGEVEYALTGDEWHEAAGRS
ncbi:GNAT family N-acetyltransferase [Streptosporangium sandarakinum]|uniref:GNAT family N-acetyltransferase n=1 Tax=Streptosporangium sandarakinum TaxID=1260955 RepID=UPI003D939996